MIERCGRADGKVLTNAYAKYRGHHRVVRRVLDGGDGDGVELQLMVGEIFIDG